MSYTLHSLDLKGKKIINTENGKVVAAINEVLFDPKTNAIAALVTSKAGLFNRTTEIVPCKDVTLLGQDVVLADHPDIVVSKNDVAGADEWLQVSDQLRGISVLTTQGTRIGKLEDLVVDEKGKVKALLVTDMNGRNAQEIPGASLHSIGRDAIIVEPASKETAQQVAQTPHTIPSNTVGVFDTEHHERNNPPVEPVNQQDLHREEHSG